MLKCNDEKYHMQLKKFRGEKDYYMKAEAAIELIV
jgi:hypothetical protein